MLNTKRIVVGLAALALTAAIAPSQACDIPSHKRAMTVAEMVAGLNVIFAGTVVGYQTEDGTTLMGPTPRLCHDEYGDYDWVKWGRQSTSVSACNRYLDVSAALFRVDAHIVGPEEGEVVAEFMTWGDGDCNIDFQIGDEWLIAGFWYTHRLSAPLQPSEVALLQRLAKYPAFDVQSIIGIPPGH